MTPNNATSEQVLSTLRQIIRAIDVHSKQLSKNFGLTGPQLVLIKEIAAQHGEISVSELARRVSLSQATVTTIVDRLEQRDLVTRHRSSEDKRKVILCTTPKARELLQSNPTFLQEQFIRKFEQLQGWEQMQILSSIQRIAEMMNADAIESQPMLGNESLSAEAAHSSSNR